MHNETINIWSHLVGFLLVIILFFHTAYLTPAVVISKDYAPISPFGHSLIENGRHSFSMIALLIKPELMKSVIPYYHNEALSEISHKKIDDVTPTDLETIRIFFPEFSHINDDNELITLLNSTSVLHNFTNTEINEEEKLLDLLSHSYYKTTKTSYLDVYIYLL